MGPKGTEVQCSKGDRIGSWPSPGQRNDSSAGLLLERSFCTQKKISRSQRRQ